MAALLSSTDMLCGTSQASVEFGGWGRFNCRQAASPSILEISVYHRRIPDLEMKPRNLLFTRNQGDTSTKQEFGNHQIDTQFQLNSDWMAQGINVLASIFPSTGFQYVNMVRATCIYHENSYPSANSSSSVLPHQIHPSQLPVYSFSVL